MRFMLILLSLSLSLSFFAQDPLITNLPSRKKQSLNGPWQYIVDPYETGFYDYRYL
jgi:beta-glucuronidase